MYLLGYDIGSSSVKASLVNAETGRTTHTNSDTANCGGGYVNDMNLYRKYFIINRIKIAITTMPKQPLANALSL